ncbi:MAG TPA: L,D-transpeptidase [Methylocystis sp.]|nr:L,D-transpeptidase [Methylocystis sp.]
MSRSRAPFVALLSATLLTLQGGSAAAQYGWYPPYGGYYAQPYYGRAYPDPRGYDRGYEDDYDPRARPRSRGQTRNDDDLYDEVWRPADPYAGAPRGRARVASLPPDADPNYSTPENHDEDIDFNQTTAAVVADPTGQRSNTITIDTAKRKLYFSLGDGRAVEYGVGVGREGFAWKGQAQIGRKAFWPGWTPPKEMLLRRPDLPVHMEGGIENPLGARALYLFKGDRDSGFRIHGTNEPDTIGQAVSSGCIRMLNADVIDLYRRTKVGTRVVVL